MRVSARTSVHVALHELSCVSTYRLMQGVRACVPPQILNAL